MQVYEVHIQIKLRATDYEDAKKLAEILKERIRGLSPVVEGVYVTETEEE